MRIEGQGMQPAAETHSELWLVVTNDSSDEIAIACRLTDTNGIYVSSLPVPLRWGPEHHRRLPLAAMATADAPIGCIEHRHPEAQFSAPYNYAPFGLTDIPRYQDRIFPPFQGGPLTLTFMVFDGLTTEEHTISLPLKDQP